MKPTDSLAQGGNSARSQGSSEHIHSTLCLRIWSHPGNGVLGASVRVLSEGFNSGREHQPPAWAVLSHGWGSAVKRSQYTRTSLHLSLLPHEAASPQQVSQCQALGQEGVYSECVSRNTSQEGVDSECVS